MARKATPLGAPSSYNGPRLVVRFIDAQGKACTNSNSLLIEASSLIFIIHEAEALGCWTMKIPNEHRR